MSTSCPSATLRAGFTLNMAGQVAYKFKSSTTVQTVNFDGPHIALAELRAAIVRDNHIVKGRDFFLLELSNAQTGEIYAEDALVGRNTSVLVKRVPLQRREAIESKGGGTDGTDITAAANAAAPTAASNPDAASTHAAGHVRRGSPIISAPAPPPAPTIGGANYTMQLIDPLTNSVFVDAVITTCCARASRRRYVQAPHNLFTHPHRRSHTISCGPRGAAALSRQDHGHLPVVR